MESVPNEVIKLQDEVMIRNFEVDFEEEEEIRYAGGIKGIKALRMQRDLINKEIEQKQPPVVDMMGNKFADFERELEL